MRAGNFGFAPPFHGLLLRYLGCTGTHGASAGRQHGRCVLEGVGVWRRASERRRRAWWCAVGRDDVGIGQGGLRGAHDDAGQGHARVVAGHEGVRRGDEGVEGGDKGMFGRTW